MITKFKIFENDNSDDEENFDKYKNDIEKVFETKEWLIIKPKSFEAFCYYGQDQGWSDVDNGRKYNFKTETYININKEDDKKIVLNLDRADFYTEDDDPIYLKEFLDENPELYIFYGNLVTCSNVIKEDDEYWLMVDDYSYFADYFDTDRRDISEKFVKGVLGGDSYTFFQYDQTGYDIDDYGIELIEDNFLRLKMILILLKFNNEEDYDYNLDEIKDYDDIVEIIKEYDIDDFESYLKIVVCKSHEYADADKAFIELLDAGYDFFELEDKSAKWLNYKGSKNQKLFIKFKDETAAIRAKFIINNYDDSFSEKIDYSPPYYGYQGETKDINEYFNSELLERFEDINIDDVTDEMVNKNVEIWKKFKKDYPTFTDDQLYAEFEVFLNTNKYNM